MNQIIDTNKALIIKLSDKIVLLEFKPDVIFELEDAIEVNTLIYNLVKGQPFLSLVDISNRYGSISKEAREHFAKDPKTKDIRLAEAFIITNIPMRILANFYKSFHKPNNPIKFFKTKKEAIDWLNSF
jgi:hypothetical protein